MNGIEVLLLAVLLMLAVICLLLGFFLVYIQKICRDISIIASIFIEALKRRKAN